MKIIGERINSTRKPIQEALEKRDRAFILKEAKAQLEAGAEVLDLNAGAFIKEEPVYLKWLVEIIQAKFSVPLALDSPNIEALNAALEVVPAKTEVIINSITPEKERFDNGISLVKKYSTSVIGLCMDEEGIPRNKEKRLKVAETLIKKLKEEGIEEERIYLDPVIQPISTDTSVGKAILESIKVIKTRYPRVHIVLGLSNISFGLPNRRLINRTFLTMATAVGVDTVIADPLDKDLITSIRAAEMLLGKDEFCLKYLESQRS
jgi:5-methyltetrahydrofolate--homocysteine methyltransferase